MRNWRSDRSCWLPGVLAGCVAVVASASGAADDQVTFEYVASGMLDNLSKLRSGRGTVHWRGVGERFAPGDKEPRTFQATFAFDGDRIRYDQVFGYDRLAKKTANNGKLCFEYLEQTQTGKPLANPDAYIRPPDAFRGGERSGEAVNIVKVMEPFAGGLTECLEALKGGQVTVRMSRTAEGLYLAELAREGKEGSEWQLLFDPEKGYNIVSEKRTHQGSVLEDISRTFTKSGDVWVLKILVHTRYAPGTAGEKDGVQELHVDEIELNVKMSESTFDLRGFGLPPTTHVWDTVTGIDYTLDPFVAVADQIDKILASVDAKSEGKTAGSPPTSLAVAGSASSGDPGAFGGPQGTAGHHSGLGEGWVSGEQPKVISYAAVLLGGLIVAGGLLWWRRFRRNPGRSG